MNNEDTCIYSRTTYQTQRWHLFSTMRIRHLVYNPKPVFKFLGLLAPPTNFTLRRLQPKQKIINRKSPWTKTAEWKASYVTLSFITVTYVFAAVLQVTTVQNLEARPKPPSYSDVRDTFTCFYESSSPCAILSVLLALMNIKCFSYILCQVRCKEKLTQKREKQKFVTCLKR